VKKETSYRSIVEPVHKTELVDDEKELVDEDHDSDADKQELLDPKEYRQILNEIRAADISLSPELQCLVVKFTVEVVRDALAALLECRKKGSVGKPAGYLYRAIQEQWKPTIGTGVNVKKRLSAMPEEVRPPSDEQLDRLDECKALGSILDYFLSSDGICKVVMPGGFVMKPWWEFLED